MVRWKQISDHLHHASVLVMGMTEVMTQHTRVVGGGSSEKEVTND